MMKKANAEQQTLSVPVERIVMPEFDVAEWNKHWNEAIRRTQEEVDYFLLQGFTREDEPVWFRENMIEHMKTKIVKA